ncbi:N-formylglutamate amidohydrolase [Sneathiella glossodoripedis]|uniref:N-formylglutamate amidohydrolase n=1 Tax=Sneathiella glossodoripedis TaxID=418853 RepID=UPI000471FBE2|nr:N-formylglutamate amidohydrolase [Sneathiella glossodoripedis]
MSDPYYLLNEESQTPVFLIADHASREIPEKYNNLGIEDVSLLRRHVAWDIGIEDVTKRMAERLGCTAIFSKFSRLLIDANRYPDDPSSTPYISDGVVVPMNENVTDEDRQERISTYFSPYHFKIEAILAQKLKQHKSPLVISMHSFTPIMNDFERPWHVGVLWDQDGRIALPMLDVLRKNPTLVVGDNEPYSARKPLGYTMNEHGTKKNIPHVVVEIRQDLIDTHHGAEQWAGLMVDVINQIADKVSQSPPTSAE